MHSPPFSLLKVKNIWLDLPFSKFINFHVSCQTRFPRFPSQIDGPKMTACGPCQRVQYPLEIKPLGHHMKTGPTGCDSAIHSPKCTWILPFLFLHYSELEQIIKVCVDTNFISSNSVWFRQFKSQVKVD